VHVGPDTDHPKSQSNVIILQQIVGARFGILVDADGWNTNDIGMAKDAPGNINQIQN
jgi:hypothetical protein